MKGQNHQELLAELTEKAIQRLESMTKPIVRICGPLTTYGVYEENLRRFAQATDILTKKGYTVFDYFEGEDEERIREAEISWDDVMEHYHKPILAAGLMDGAFFLPHWEESSGAVWEHDFISKHTHMKIELFPEEWFK